VCIITTKENVVKCFPKFKNGQDMMVANKMRNFSKYFEKVLLNKKLKNKMINSAQEKYIKYYSARLAIKRNIDIMKKISNV
jgi:spore maturation protein CgeB